jgi:hypothetical protein
MATAGTTPDYHVVDRKLVSIDPDRAVYEQRRRMMGLPPNPAADIANILLILGIFPLAGLIAVGPSRAGVLLAAAVAIAIFSLRARFVRSRRRVRKEFFDRALELRAAVDSTADTRRMGPNVRAAIRRGATFVVRFSRPEGACILELGGRELHRVPLNRVRITKPGGHSLPWSDMYDSGEPPDYVVVNLVIDEPPLPDFEGPFYVGGDDYGGPKIAEAEAMARRFANPVT